MSNVIINTYGNTSEVIINGEKMTLKGTEVSVTRKKGKVFVNGKPFAPSKSTVSTSDKYKIVEGRVVALRNIPSLDIKVGDIGGKVSNEYSLAQSGECWVDYHSEIHDTSKVSGNTFVMKSTIKEGSTVSGNAIVVGSDLMNSHASGNSRLHESTLEHSSVSGNAHPTQSTLIRSRLSGNASAESSTITKVVASGNASVVNSVISDMILSGNKHINGINSKEVDVELFLSKRDEVKDNEWQDPS